MQYPVFGVLGIVLVQEIWQRGFSTGSDIELFVKPLEELSQHILHGSVVRQNILKSGPSLFQKEALKVYHVLFRIFEDWIETQKIFGVFCTWEQMVHVKQ